MKRLFTFLSIACLPFLANAQCSTTNATSCQCPDGVSQECDLLPDITISWQCLRDGSSGPNETPGRLEVSGSTPNIGHGPLEMRGADQNGNRWFVCGTDTVSINDPNSNVQFACPNGAVPEHIQFQRIYHKNGNTMSFTERMIPNAATYHPSHGHNHFDEWGVFTLRYEDVTLADPRNWPIVGRGHKLGFCLMDYYTCSGAPNDDCRDDNTVYQQGNVLNNSDFPNYGLGGGNYGCGQVRQGISSGYTDVYYEYLDGMWIDIPEGTCNGDYWIVYEVDPNDIVLEENEENNFTAIPYTLTEQGTSNNPVAVIQAEQGRFVCEDDSVLLRATAGSSYLWSTGATSATIYGHPNNAYSVDVTGYCGTATSQPVSIESIPKPDAPTTTDADVCIAAPGNTVTATLTATGTDIVWYDEFGNTVGAGNSFTTPELTETTDFYAASVMNEQTSTYGGKIDNSGGGGNLNSDQSLLFDTYMPITIKSVKVYAQGAGNRTIRVTDQVQMYIASGVFYLQDGEQRVDLNFEIPVGVNYQLGLLGDINLFRNNAGVNYPYTLQDTLSITNSSAGEDYYYYFYDWEIVAGQTSCSSDMSEATAVVSICTGVVDDYDMTNRISAYPNPSEGTFALDIRMPGTADVKLSILDLAGRVVHQQLFSSVSGNFLETISIPNASAGVYGLSLEINNRRYFKRLTVY